MRGATSKHDEGLHSFVRVPSAPDFGVVSFVSGSMPSRLCASPALSLGQLAATAPKSEL